MTALSRVTDIGEGDCPDHGKYHTKYITGAKSVFTNNLIQTIVTTVGEQDNCDKAHSKATTGSATVFAENQPVHRIDDTGKGHAGDTYKSITGSPNVFNNGK